MKWPKSTPWHDGERKQFDFGRYIVSIVKFTGSYGYKDNLWELAIIDRETQEFTDLPIEELTYYPPKDVGIYGYLNDPDVDRILQGVQRYECQRNSNQVKQ